MHHTIRQEILEALENRELSAKEISALVSIPEKEVHDHLEHIRKTAQQMNRRLSVTAAVCRTCGFEFRKRTRLTKPGKCPICKGTHVEEPRFSIA